MNKPSGYDEVRPSGDFTPINLGGHYAVIKKVEEKESKTGKAMIVVYYDFDTKDSQPAYFMNEFRNDVRPEKKWPFAGSKYIMQADYNVPNKVSRDFKTFCTCVEKSNNYSIQWGDNWGEQFKNKKIGVVFGEVESEYNGKIYKRHEPRWFCNIDKVESANVPAPKTFNGAHSNSAPQTGNTNGFINVPDSAVEDVPF